MRAIIIFVSTAIVGNVIGQALLPALGSGVVVGAGIIGIAIGLGLMYLAKKQANAKAFAASRELAELCESLDGFLAACEKHRQAQIAFNQAKFNARKALKADIASSNDEYVAERIQLALRAVEDSPAEFDSSNFQHVLSADGLHAVMELDKAAKAALEANRSLVLAEEGK